jgi:hypothetical protein
MMHHHMRHGLLLHKVYNDLYPSYAKPNRDDKLESGALRPGAGATGVNLIGCQ